MIRGNLMVREENTSIDAVHAVYRILLGYATIAAKKRILEDG